MMLVVVLQMFVIASLVWCGRRRTEDALPVFCFFLTVMPLESRLVIPGLFDLTPMRISLLVLLVLFVAHRKPPNPDRLPLKNLMLLHVMWATCSAALSLSVATSIKQLISQVLEYYLMYFLLVRNITKKKTIYKILYAMMMAITICCIFALLEAYGSYSILRIFPRDLWITYNGGLDPLYIELARGLRVRSTFPHPILFGDALAMSIPIALYLLSIWREKMQRTLLWAGLLLMAWAIYKTSSRGPWMGAGACCTLLVLMVKNRLRRYLFIVAGLLLIVLLARPGIWDTMSSIYSVSTDTTSPVGTSYLFRHALNEAIKQAVRRDPRRFLLGYGLGTFREQGLDINFLGEVSRWYTCDNNWAAFLYETGYGGLLIMFVLLGKTLLIAWRGYRRLPAPEDHLSGVLFISLGGFYFLLLSVAGYSWGQQGYMAWVLISLAVSLSRFGGRRTQLPPSHVEHELDEKVCVLA
jgi:O-antigen ligase/polysaccharide polymerase Wzy-like membrane protein